jgi:hypothetical protein
MANYWDIIKKAIGSTVGNAAGAIPQAATSLAGGLVQRQVTQMAPGVSVAPITEQRNRVIGDITTNMATKAVNVVTKPAEVARLDTAFNLGMKEIDQFYQWAYPKVSRPISTALLTGADVAANDGIDIIKNWKLAKEISPGQAFISPYVELFNPDFNIASADDRKKTFENDENIFGKIASGAVDGLLNWYADPLVVAGKGLKVVRETELIRPIKTSQDVVRLRSELDTHGVYLKSNGAIGRETPMGVVAQRLTGKTAAEAYDDIFVRRTTNPTLLAGLIGEAKNYDDVSNFIAAAAGDTNSLEKIAKTRASIADEIKRSQDLLDPVQKQYNSIEFGAATKIEQHIPTIEEYDRLNNVLNDLKVRDANLERAMSERLGDYRVVNEYTSAADVQLFNKNIGVAIEKARAASSQLRHDFSFYTETFQKSPFTRPVVVIQAAFNKLPRGIVRVDGGPVADSYSEIKYALNSVKPLRNMEYIPVKNELARAYMNARNATERMVAVENIESEIADIIALENGVSIEEAQRWYKVFGSVRRGMMDSFSQHGFWVDDTGKLITSPFWKSEMPNVVPMMDFKDFDKFLKIYKQVRPLGETATEIALKSRLVGQEAEDMLDFANSIFKASVLTRMGYPIRNTLDGQLRAALALGSLAKSDDIIKNLKSNVKTRIQKTENFVDETLGLSNPGQLRDQIGRLVTQRGQVVDVRNSILKEITPTQYYAGAAGTFGKQIDPGMVELSISSKTAPLLTERQRNAYFELAQKQKKQKGLLFGEDKNKFKDLQAKAFGKYIRQEVVPNLPEGTVLVYADFPSGKVFYKVPGKGTRLPKGAIPDIETRNALPSSLLADELEMSGKFKPRAKGPIQRPDVRVITSYEASKSANYEDIAELLGEEQMNRIRHYQNMADEYENLILDKVVQSQKLAERRAELKIIRSGEGTNLYTSPSGAKIEADGAFAGPNGILHRQDAGSDNTLNWMTENQTYLSYDAVKGIDSKSYAGKLGEGRVVVQPTDPQYFNEMSVFANQILRQDQLAMRILAGQGDSEIASWLRSEKGNFYLREINADIDRSQIRPHISEARSRIYKLFPDEQMRSLVSREELSPEQFDLLMRGSPTLAPIAGRSFVDDTLRYNKGVIKSAVNNAISKVFKVIGSTPENNLVAWPFYEKLYKQNLQKEINIAEGLGKNIQDPDLIIQLQRSSHLASRKTVNDVLYRMSNNTGISSVMRFLVPFFNAQYNAVKVYGKFFLEDPSRIARASQIWNLPNRIADVVDENGNSVPPGAPPSVQQYILFTIPEGIQGRWGIPKGYQISIPKNSLNVFLTGDNPLAPSFGIPVTIPVSVLANNRPDRIESVRSFLNEFVGTTTSTVIMNSILPFGRAAERPWDLLLPAAARKYATLQGGLDDVTFANAVKSAMKTQYYEWDQNGQVGPAPDFSDAIKLAQQIYKIRMAVNLTLPFTFTFRPEWQPIIDDYRRALQDPMVGKTKVDDYILDKYGDIGYLMTAPTSKNITNLNPTVGAVVNQRKFSRLLGEMDKLNVPGLVGFIANFGNNQDKYSDAASNYFRNKSVRPSGQIKYTESRATEDVLTDRMESLGWSYYEKFAKQRDAALAQYGLKSINSKGAEQLGIKDAWDKSVQSIKDYLPAWSQAYDDSVGDFTKTKRYVKGLIKATQDKKWMEEYGKSTTMQAVSDYVINRDYLARELANRKTNLGSGGLNDPNNADIKDAWDEYILKMKLWDNGFGDFYTRYLENDNYEVING